MEIPKEIKLDCWGNIIFNNNKQLLYEENGEFSVNTADRIKSYNKLFVMVPCDFEDLAVGDTFVKRYEDVIVGEGIEVDFFVYKVLKNKRFCGTSLYDEGVSVFSYDEYNPNLDYFKVVKRSEVKEWVGIVY